MQVLELRTKFLLFFMITSIFGCVGNDFMEIDLEIIYDYPLSVDEVKKILSSNGFKEDDYIITGKIVKTKKLDVAVFVNRIKAHLNMFEDLPFFVYEDLDNGNIYVTSNPWEFKPDVSYNDYLLQNLESVDEKILHKVDKDNIYLNMTRDFLKKNYFNKTGSLNTGDNDRFDSDYNFIYALIVKGFYVFIGDESGDLAIE